MTVDNVKDHYVTWANAMRKLGLSQNSYQYWVKQGYIPINMQRIIQEETKGRLKSVQ